MIAATKETITARMLATMMPTSCPFESDDDPPRGATLVAEGEADCERVADTDAEVVMVDDEDKPEEDEAVEVEDVAEVVVREVEEGVAAVVREVAAAEVVIWPGRITVAGSEVPPKLYSVPSGICRQISVLSEACRCVRGPTYAWPETGRWNIFYARFGGHRGSSSIGNDHGGRRQPWRKHLGGLSHLYGL